MYKAKRPLIAITMFLVSAHFGSQEESVAGREKPHINFYGTLTDTSGKKYEVDNITISGMYKQIPVYQKPDNKNVNPSINTTRIDFTEVQSIHVPHPTTFLTFNNRQYIEIEVTSKNLSEGKSTHLKENYIIERTKRLICDQVNSAGPIEKDLSFEAVDTVTFTKHKVRQPEEKPVKEPKKEEKARGKKAVPEHKSVSRG